MRAMRGAAEGNYSGQLADISVRPEIAVWRKVRSGTRQEQALTPYVVDELMRTTDAAERDELFLNMKYDEANMLRRTKGRAAKAYRGEFYRKDGESARQFARRAMIAGRSDRQNSR